MEKSAKHMVRSHFLEVLHSAMPVLKRSQEEIGGVFIASIPCPGELHIVEVFTSEGFLGLQTAPFNRVFAADLEEFLENAISDAKIGLFSNEGDFVRAMENKGK